MDTNANPASQNASEPASPRATGHDIGEGLVGALGMAACLLTTPLRGRRARWGVDEPTAARAYPGDALVPAPSWAWTHGVTIAAPAEAVWPWVVQIGQERAGFYSYQFLENLFGCQIHNADRIHAEWQDRRVGDTLRLHPRMPPLRVEQIEAGRWFVVASPADSPDGTRVSWLFLVEPLGPGRSRFLSRYRIRHPSTPVGRLTLGPTLIEPIGFMMDRRMLLGVKARAERALRS